MALMDGIVESLVDRQLRREVLKARRNSPAAEKHLNMQALRRRFTKIAEAEAEGVFCDLQALIGITDVRVLLSGVSCADGLCLVVLHQARLREIRDWVDGLY